MVLTQVKYKQTGTGASVRTLSNNFADTFSVKDFGATGDGSTNDTTALQNALNAAAGTAKLYLPAGTYIVHDTLVVPSNTHFVGSGELSIIKMNSSIEPRTTLVRTGQRNDKKKNIIIENMTLDFNKARHSVSAGSYPADSIIDDTSLGGDAYQDHWGCTLSICFSENVLINNVRALDAYKHCIDVSSPKYRSSTAVNESDFEDVTNLATSIATPQIYDTVSRTGTSTGSSYTLTVTLTSHGFSVGDRVYLDVTGTSHDGVYEIQTVADANTFTVTTETTSSHTNQSCTVIQDQGSRQVTIQNCYAKGAGDDNITTHFSSEVLITGCTSEYPCGKLVGTNSNCYEIDDGSRNVTITDCTALGGVKGIQIKGHRYSPAPYNVTVDGVRIINCAQGLDIKHLSWGELWANTSTGGGTITNPAGQIKTGSITYTGGSPTAKNVSVSNVQIIAPRSVKTEESNAVQAVEEAVMVYAYENVVLNNIVVNEGTNDIAGDYSLANGQSNMTSVVRVYLGAQNVSFNNLSINGFKDAAVGFYVTSTILDHINVDGLIIQGGPKDGVHFQGSSATPEASGSIDNFYITGDHSSTSGSKGLQNDLFNIRIGSGRVTGYETNYDLAHNKGPNYPAFWGNQDTSHDVTSGTWTALVNMGSNNHGAIAGEGGHFAEATGKFTVPNDGAGLYFLTANAAMEDLDENDYVRLRFFKNGSAIGPFSQARQSHISSNNINTWGAALNGIYKLDAGDYIEARVYHNLGNSGTEPTEDVGCWFGGFRIASF